MEGFYIYAILFRLAIILVGSLAIYLGFRLYVLGVMPRENTTIEAGSNELHLKLKNAAPGTVFAVFGALIIIAMLVQGNPKYDVMIKDGQQQSITVRGGKQNISMQSDKQVTTGRNNDLNEKNARIVQVQTELILEEQLIKKEAASPLLSIAKVYASEEWYDEAILLSNIVIALDAENSADAYNLKQNIRTIRDQ